MSRAGTIDGLQFAHGREVVSGTLGIDDLPRLTGLGCEAATLRYAVRGGENVKDRPSLTIEVAGELRVQCQRCLAPLELPLATTAELELAGTQAEIDAADDDVDRVVASQAMDVAALVEDEAILALPMVPMHRQCETGIAPVEPGKRTPFAELAGLRKGGTDPNGSSR
jgi:uncharacterized protein